MSIGNAFTEINNLEIEEYFFFTEISTLYLKLASNNSSSC